MTTPVSRAWEVWAAENLLRGVAREKVEERLVQEGLSPEEATALVAGLLGSPVAEAAAAFVRDAKRFRMIARLRAERPFDVTRAPFDVGDLPGRRAAGLPVVLTGLVSRWPAIERWRLDVLESRFGEVEISTTVERDRPAADYSATFRRKTERVKVGTLVEWMRSAKRPDVYVVALNRALEGPLGGMLDDVTLPAGLLDAPLAERASLWMGPAGTLTTLHHDRSDILAGQVVGRKAWRLIDPTDAALLGRVRGVATTLAAGEIQGARVHDVVVEPGEALLVPVGWWHEVRALDASISLSIALDPQGRLEYFRPGDA